MRQFEHHLKSEGSLCDALWTLSGCRWYATVPPDSSYLPLSRLLSTDDQWRENLRDQQFSTILRDSERNQTAMKDRQSTRARLPRGAGWCGTSPPMQVGHSQGLQRREVHARAVASCKAEISGELFMDDIRAAQSKVYRTLWHGRPSRNCPFQTSSVRELECSVASELERDGWRLERQADDRRDVRIGFRYKALVLDVTEDREISLGSYAPGIRVGPVARMQRLPSRRTGAPDIRTGGSSRIW